MIDISTYRSRIGIFIPKRNSMKFKKSYKGENTRRSRSYKFVLMCQLVLLLSFFSALWVAASFEEYTPLLIYENPGPNRYGY